MIIVAYRSRTNRERFLTTKENHETMSQYQMSCTVGPMTCKPINQDFFLKPYIVILLSCHTEGKKFDAPLCGMYKPGSTFVEVL
jgi:hypothetical protein